MSGLDIPLEGKSIRQLCGIVLVFEAIVIGLAIPVAIVLEHANHGLAGGVGGALAVCAILISWRAKMNGEITFVTHINKDATHRLVITGLANCP